MPITRRTTSQNLLILDTPAGQAQPKVVNGTVTVYGDLVHLATDTHDVLATGKVQTKSTPSPPADEAKPPSPGLFDANQPVFGASTKLVYESTSQKATYYGAGTEVAEVYQTQSQSDVNQNRVRGDLVVVEQATNNLHATGHVSSLFASAPKPAAAPASTPPGADGPALLPRPPRPPVAPTIYHGKAQELVYTDATQLLAHYIGLDGLGPAPGPGRHDDRPGD